MTVLDSDLPVAPAPRLSSARSGAAHRDPVLRLDPPPVLSEALVQFHITLTGCFMACRDCGAVRDVLPADVPQQVLGFQSAHLDCDPILQLPEQEAC